MHSIAVGIAHPDALRSCGICLSGCASEMHIVALLAGVRRRERGFRSTSSAHPPPPQAAGCGCCAGGVVCATRWQQSGRATGSAGAAGCRAGMFGRRGPVDGRMGGAVRGGGSGFRVPPGADSGAQIRASRRASAPTRRAVRARGWGGWERSESTHKSSVLQVLQSVAIESKIHTWMESPAFAQFIGPSRARDPGVQTTRMDAVFQRLSRETLKCILGVRLAETMEMGQYRFPHHIKR
eukprot:gene11695-biopygen3373